MKGKKITATVLTILLVFAMLPVQVLAGEELTEDLISDEIDVIDGDPEIEDIQEENLNADGMLPEEDGLTPDGDGGEYTLTLDPDYTGGYPETIECSEYTLPLYPDGTRSGYTHIGWCTAPYSSYDGSEEYYNPGTVIKLTNNHRTLYARWKATRGNMHTLWFDANGGIGDYMEPVLVDDNSQFTVPACKLYISERLFNGWATTADGEPQYQTGDPITIDGNITLYATWKDIPTTTLDDISRVDTEGKVYIGLRCWRIIGSDVQGKKKLLLCDDIVGGEKLWDNAKKQCDDSYADEFSFNEKTAVMRVNQSDTDYVTSDNYTYGAVDLSNAKLFLLSAYEAFAKYFTSDQDRKVDQKWWLRSSFDYEDAPDGIIVGMVSENGVLENVEYEDGDNIYQCYSRPAFVLNMSSALFTSAAESDAKFSAPSDGSSFGDFLDGGTGDKKLTLHDSTRDDFSASVNGQSSVTIGSGEGSLTVNYKGAVTGADEMVSAMLCASDGSVIGYASMTPTTRKAASWDMTLPVLSDGVYTLKVFSEQQNKSERTDYASRISEITLTVGESAKSDQTITASNFTKTYGDRAFAIGATTDGNGTLSYLSDNTAVVDVDGNGTVTIKGAGEANITITASETEIYNSAAKKIKITVKKAAQTITASDVSKTMGDASFSLGAKASGDGKLTYTSGNTSVVTVDTSGKVTIKGVGKTTIKIDAVETDNYNSATKTINVTVNAAPVKTYKVTVLSDGNGTASASPASGATGTMVTITADPKNGYDFKEWTVVSGGVKLAEPKKASTTFKIGSANVEVKALFKQKTNPTPDPKKTNISGATVELSAKSFTYKNKAQKPVVRSVKLGKKTLKADKDYTVMFPKSSKNAGTYKITVKGIGNYTGSVTANYTIKQADNPLNVTAVKKEYTVKYSDLTKKNKTIEKKKIFNFKKNGAGKITYSLSSAKKGKKSFKKYFSISSKGKLTIKKGLEKGTYSVKINVKAKGNKNYKEATKTVKFTVRVKK